MKTTKLLLIILFSIAIAACGGGGSSSSSGSNSSGNWYYHWNCNGDSECLATNSAGTPSGTAGPISGGQVGCNSLMTFGNKFWGIPPATQSCDKSPSGGGTTSYTIGGNISGLTGTGLVLQNNGGNNLSVTANGSLNFTTQLPTSSTYAVTVLTQPSGQTCTITNGNGTVNNANVTNITLSCSNTTTTYTIGGNISGLTGTGLVLQNNGGNNLSVTANGSLNFTTQLPTSSTYAVTVLTQPSGQTCTVTNGNGTVNNANVTNFAVSCSNTALSCISGNGSGTNGIHLYNPSNWFTYQLSTTTANVLDTATLGWGAAYTGTTGAYTGSLLASLWAVSSSYSGGTINGIVLGNFSPNFTGAGAYSSSQIWAGGYSTNTIVSSASNYNPSAGQYCLVVILEQYMPVTCSSQNGYCIVDWLQFNAPVTFH